MEQIVLLAIQAVEALLPMLESATSGQVSKVILLLEQAIPLGEKLGEDLLTPITNIISALQGNVNVTPEQISTLDGQMTAAEATLDALIKQDGLGDDDVTTSGTDPATGSTGAKGA